MSDAPRVENAVAAVVTLRDYFAATAPTKFINLDDACALLGEEPMTDLSGGTYSQAIEQHVRGLAKFAYLYADAMLKAREGA